MATYSEVKTRFLSLLNRRDITTTQTTTFLQDALARIQRNLRIPAMERAIATTPPDTGLAIPSDYLQMIRITDANGRELERSDFSTVMSYAETPGTPLIYARRGSRFLIGPVPTDDVRLDYYAQFDGLSADGDENLITLISPDLLVYAALSYAGEHFNDKRQPAWEQRYTTIFTELQDQADRDELLNATVTPAYHVPTDEEDY